MLCKGSNFLLKNQPFILFFIKQSGLGVKFTPKPPFFDSLLSKYNVLPLTPLYQREVHAVCKFLVLWEDTDCDIEDTCSAWSVLKGVDNLVTLNLCLCKWQ
mgnify:CR=1 FL=1